MVSASNGQVIGSVHFQGRSVRQAKTIRGCTSALLLLSAATAQKQQEWLSLCGQCLSPSVTSKSGIGTDHAVVEGRVTRRDAEMWCAAWQPSDHPEPCIREQLATEQGRQSYRATADCVHGRITALDGETYTYAGIWNADIGKGRSKWRSADGKIVGQDEASGGLAIAQQWEVLCPGPFKGSVTAAPVPSATPAKAPPLSSSSPKSASTPSPAVRPDFAIGELVEAKYAGSWVRGKVQGLRQIPGSASALEYDVVLQNGKHGILPASMLRKPQVTGANP